MSKKEKPISNVNVSLEPLLVAIDVLAEHPQNARLHHAQNMRAIMASLATFGQQKPIVYDSATGHVLAGNGTLRCARELGWTHVAAVPFDRDANRGIGYMEADNRTTDLSTWDHEAHAAMLTQLQEVSKEWGENGLDAIGWTTEDLATLTTGVGEDRDRQRD